MQNAQRSKQTTRFLALTFSVAMLFSGIVSSANAATQNLTETGIEAAELKLTGITPSVGEAVKGPIFIKDLAGMGFLKDTIVKLRLEGEDDIDAY